MTRRMILWAPPSENNSSGEEEPQEEDAAEGEGTEEESSEEEQYETEFEANLAKNHPELLDEYRKATSGLVSALHKEREGNKSGKDAKKKVKEFEEKEAAAARDQRTKEENLQNDLDAATKRADDAEAELKKLKDENVISQVAGSLKFQAPEDAMLFIDMGSVERDDDGRVVEADVKKKLQAVLKDKPYLAESANLGPGNGTGGEGGRQLDKDPKKKKNYKANQPKITI